MIRDETLVEIFVSQFYRNRVTHFTGMVSPNFTYQGPDSNRLDFFEFLSHCNIMYKSVRAFVKSVHTDDGISFFIDYDIKIDHKSFENGCTLSSKALVQVKEHLIENIIVDFDGSQIKDDKILEVQPEFQKEKGHDYI